MRERNGLGTGSTVYAESAPRGCGRARATIVRGGGLAKLTV